MFPRPLHMLHIFASVHRCCYSLPVYHFLLRTVFCYPSLLSTISLFSIFPLFLYHLNVLFVSMALLYSFIPFCSTVLDLSRSQSVSFFMDGLLCTPFFYFFSLRFFSSVCVYLFRECFLTCILNFLHET